MAFSSVTKAKEYLKTISKIYSNYYMQDDCSVEISSVYEDTRPREPEYLAPLREWEKKMGFVTAIRWTSAIPIVIFHLITALSIVYSVIVGSIPKWQTFLFGYFMGQVAGFGVTAGAHRYWTHRSYKATFPLQIILIICYSVAGQNNIYNWVRDHRIHHKFSETSADPHDARRGFFFSHVGWLMMKKHPDVIREGRKISMRDIANDPLVQFHTKYFDVFKFVFCFFLPTLIPVYGWHETWTNAILSQPILRYALSLNFTWSVNSFAHIWGNKPYDRHIRPAENWGVSAVAMGEGWHNYHHTFPWDYKASELAYINNITTSLLNLFAKIGWAYDLKEASPSLIKSVINNRGPTHHH
ncbi:Acyl-CoA desaturase 1 [Papilio xuthus]|uniref:Acyl-CoA desaturase 1 n=1 Tax=Papilio xuthus TaxID=66420 RepID=A0A194PGZ7_PAPXU|nr:Acyl-CoA desaturase 1 [Papilio xuthus]